MAVLMVMAWVNFYFCYAFIVVELIESYKDVGKTLLQLFLEVFSSTDN